MQKVPGIASVRVSLNEGLTVLDLKPSNTVTLAHLREVIRNNGFVTKEAKVTAAGTVVAKDANLAFQISGSGEQLMLSRGAASQSQFDGLRERSTTGKSSALVASGTADIADPKSFKMTVDTVTQP